MYEDVRPSAAFSLDAPDTSHPDTWRDENVTYCELRGLQKMRSPLKGRSGKSPESTYAKISSP